MLNCGTKPGRFTCGEKSSPSQKVALNYSARVGSVEMTELAATVISIPSAGCIELNAYCSGREICWEMIWS